MLPTLMFVSALVAQDPGADSSPRAQSPTDAVQATKPGPFDQTVAVQKGTRIDLTDCTGDVVVKTWDKDSVRVQGTPAGRRGQVSVTTKGQVLVIGASAASRMGPTVDYELTVPAWIDLHIEGQACGMDISGVSGSVTVKNQEGDIVLHGLNGTVDATSIEGSVKIDGGRGHVKASSADADITIAKATGEIEADTIDGDVKLIDVQSASVDVSTVDGDVTFSGPIQPSGKYRFATHDGAIVLNIPEASNATFAIRMYHGDLHSSLPLKAATGDARRGRPVTYTLGRGSAQVEIETFEGDVHVLKTGEVIKKN